LKTELNNAISLYKSSIAGAKARRRFLAYNPSAYTGAFGTGTLTQYKAEFWTRAIYFYEILGWGTKIKGSALTAAIPTTGSAYLAFSAIEATTKANLKSKGDAMMVI